MNLCKNIRKDVLAICILIPILVGGLSALLTKNSMNLYQTIEVPSFAPPGFLFPIVWTILFILMGISCYFVYDSGSNQTKDAIIIYAIQLALNFTWSIIFFNFRAFLLASIWIILLLVAIIMMIKQFYKISKIAAYLQIPYLVWVTFATVLTITIYILNR